MTAALFVSVFLSSSASIINHHHHTISSSCATSKGLQIEYAANQWKTLPYALMVITFLQSPITATRKLVHLWRSLSPPPAESNDTFTLRVVINTECAHPRTCGDVSHCRLTCPSRVHSTRPLRSHVLLETVPDSSHPGPVRQWSMQTYDTDAMPSNYLRIVTEKNGQNPIRSFRGLTVLSPE